MNKDLLRSLPKVDELLKDTRIAQTCSGLAAFTVTEAVRTAVEELRRDILAGTVTALPTEETLCAHIAALAHQAELPSLRGVINGTGVVLHTNLGRACLSQKATEAVLAVAGGYSTLEYDVATGGRGSRYSHVEELLKKLTGAESALVVNNNAAAVLLILSQMATGGEVITSRGELVEIGGSFRIPEIMESCGCRLKEVGATNKTHLQDYARAISGDTRALLKVHTSNYKIVGFTEAVPLQDLVALAHERGLPVIEDLGSGSLTDLNRFGIRDEPTVQESVRAGVDVVCFSGDKLLGGPQAGIIVGKQEYLDKLKKHPLNRAVRVDKLTLAALEGTLRSYAQGSALEDIPTLSMLGATSEMLHAKAALLRDALAQAGVSAELEQVETPVGGGSVPAQLRQSWAVAIAPARGSVDALETTLRLSERPIIGRIAHDKYLLDARTLHQLDFACIVQAVTESAL